MGDAPIPTKGKHAPHKRLVLEHTNSVPAREDVTSLSDFDLIDRFTMKMRAKPIHSDAAHTAVSADPIPTQSSIQNGKFFPSHSYKI